MADSRRKDYSYCTVQLASLVMMRKHVMCAVCDIFPTIHTFHSIFHCLALEIWIHSLYLLGECANIV